MKKLKILHQVLKVSNILKVLYVFLFSVIICAFGLVAAEPGITNVGDGLWFCFSSITTIGYGDFYAVTTLGRLIIGFISFYGIIIIALFTGAIVSYISEVQKAKANDSISDFLSKLENLDKLSETELKELSHKIKTRKRLK